MGLLSSNRPRFEGYIGFFGEILEIGFGLMIRFSRIGKDGRKKQRKLLVFISTGDTCRGPMAAGYFRSLLAQRGIVNIEVRSAGIMTVPGLKATPEAIQVLDTVDVDLRSHSSRKLSNESVKRADLILGMSSFHVQTALRQSELTKGKTFLLKEFVDYGESNVQIADPMGGTLEVYKKCFQEVKTCCDKLIEMESIVGKGRIEEETPVETAEVPAAAISETEETVAPEEVKQEEKAAKRKPAERKAVKKAAEEKTALPKKPAVKTEKTGKKAVPPKGKTLKGAGAKPPAFPRKKSAAKRPSGVRTTPAERRK